MIRSLTIPLLLSLVSAQAEQATPQKTNAVAVAEKNDVEVLLDQPYADGVNPKQQVDLYLPKHRKSSAPLPVIAFIHGGGWMRGDRIGTASGCISTARSGMYAAVGIGYRLTDEAGWPAQIHDCKAAIRWIRGNASKYNLDANKIAVWGSSAGGHLSSLLGTSGGVEELEGNIGSFKNVSSKVNCVVNLCGPEDFMTALMFDAKDVPIYKDDAVSALLGGMATERPEAAKAASPLTYVSADDPPFFTFHGTKDERVSFKHAELIHTALKKVGVESYLAPIVGGGHSSVGHPEVRVRGQKFVDKHFQGISSAMSEAPIQALPEERKK